MEIIPYNATLWTIVKEKGFAQICPWLFSILLGGTEYNQDAHYYVEFICWRMLISTLINVSAFVIFLLRNILDLEGRGFQKRPKNCAQNQLSQTQGFKN